MIGDALYYVGQGFIWAFSAYTWFVGAVLVFALGKLAWGYISGKYR